jgi:hypothetical protein
MKTLTISILLACGVLAAQTPQTQNENVVRMAAGQTPIYRITVTGRTAKAINYRHRSGATKIDFRGTDLLAGARARRKSRASRAISKSKWSSTTCGRPISKAPST